MDVFEFCDRLIEDYERFSRSTIDRPAPKSWPLNRGKGR